MNGFLNLLKVVTAPIEAVVDVTAEVVDLSTKPMTDGLQEIAKELRELRDDA